MSIYARSGALGPTFINRASSATAPRSGIAPFANTSPLYAGCVALDADGWPTVDVCYVIPPIQGEYWFIFTGQATSVYPPQNGGYATNTGVTVSGVTYDAGTNITTATVTATATTEALADGIFVSAVGTKRTPASAVGSGITNVKFYKKTDDPNNLFNPDLVNRMRNFQICQLGACGTSGVNGWMHSEQRVVALTGRIPDVTWTPGANYPGHTRPTGWQGWDGPSADKRKYMSWEALISLANTVGTSDIYINIPAAATNDYITKVAQTFLYGSDGVNPYTSPQVSPVWAPLNPNIKIYVEFTFGLAGYGSQGYGEQVTYWAQDLAEEERVGTDLHHLNYAAYNVPVSPDPVKPPSDITNAVGSTYARYCGYLTVIISILWREVWGDSAFNSRIRVMMSGVGQRAWHTDIALKYIQDVWGPSSSYNTIPLGDDRPLQINPKRPLLEYVYGVTPYITPSIDYWQGMVAAPNTDPTMAAGAYRYLWGPCTNMHWDYTLNTSVYNTPYATYWQQLYPQVTTYGIKLIPYVTSYGIFYGQAGMNVVTVALQLENWLSTYAGVEQIIWEGSAAPSFAEENNLFYTFFGLNNTIYGP